MIDLNTLVPQAATAGLILETAYDINESGEIVGRARTLNGGVEKAFLLTPGAFLDGALATANVDPDGFSTGGFGVGGIDGLAESLGTVVDLDNFTLLGTKATLSLPYDEAMLTGLDIAEEDIRLFWFDESHDEWLLAGPGSNNTPGGEFVLGAPTENLGDYGVDTTNNFVWANIDHASTYGLFAVPEPATMGLLSLGAMALLRKRRK